MSYPTLIVPEGVESSDGRSYPPGILTWRDKYEFMFTDKTTEGHMGAVHVGNLTNLRREYVDGVSWIVGDLEYDSDEDAREAERLATEDKLRRVSADIAVVLEATGIDEDGMPIVEIASAEIVGTTQTPMSAFGDARILIGDESSILAPRETLVASAAPRGAFFIPEPDDDDPRYVKQSNGELAIPLTFEGRQFYGHAHHKGSCHTAYGQCLDPTSWDQSFEDFHVNTIDTDDGPLAVGPCLWRGDHAPTSLDTDGARDHYTHHAFVWGHARATSGRHGIWVSGYLDESVSEDDLAILRRYGVSGDWRRGSVIAFLTVNRSALGVRRDLAASAEEVAMADRLEVLMVNDRIDTLVAGPTVMEGEPKTRDDLIVDALRHLSAKIDALSGDWTKARGAVENNDGRPAEELIREDREAPDFSALGRVLASDD